MSINTALTFSIIVAIVAYFYFNYEYLFTQVNLIFPKDVIEKKHRNNIFTAEQLKKYNGIDEKRLYLAILGNVFDVSKGKKHYERGNGYHYFIGKDGSRSFISGNFEDESSNKDHVVDLSCKELDILVNWLKTYKTTYIYKGKLIGRYYNEEGKETLYKRQLTDKINKCKLEKQNEHDLKFKYPPCNIEWNAEIGSVVWCSKNSGGVAREWVGVPRKQFKPGESIQKCICVNTSEDHMLEAMLEEYENCLPDSVSCKIEST